MNKIKYAKNRAYAFVEEQQAALDAGQITEAEWFEAHNEHFTSHYLASDDPRAQSGSSGDAARYRAKKLLILEALHKNGSFIDIGCANGHLIECLAQWVSGLGLEIEFFGLDISPGLIELAKDRLPHWRERFFLGNALYWRPSQPYDYVYLMGMEYVPEGRKEHLFEHLMTHVVASGGRFIYGPTNEERNCHDAEDKFRNWGHPPSGYCERSYENDAGLVRKLYWFDKG